MTVASTNDTESLSDHGTIRTVSQEGFDNISYTRVTRQHAGIPIMKPAPLPMPSKHLYKAKVTRIFSL